MQYQWPNGLLDASRKFSIPDVPDFKTMASLPVQLVVGEEDLEIIDTDPASNAGEGMGETRVDKIRRLKAALYEIEVQSELEVVPSAGHSSEQMIPALKVWLGPLINGTGNK